MQIDLSGRPAASIAGTHSAMADAAAKAQVAREVCAAAEAFAACQHRRPSPRRRPHFIDHYLILQIDEAASEEDINRRYRQLALLLHPDKNADSNALAAFRLVSEAKACLTDMARRRAFDGERARAFCAACHVATSHRDSAESTTSPAPSVQPKQQEHGSVDGVSRKRPPAPALTPTPTLQEVQKRLQEELRIIEDCLRGQGDVARRRRRQSDTYTVFEPSEEARLPAYPRARPPFAGSQGSRRGCRDRETPVYQGRTE